MASTSGLRESVMFKGGRPVHLSIFTGDLTMDTQIYTRCARHKFPLGGLTLLTYHRISITRKKLHVYKSN